MLGREARVPNMTVKLPVRGKASRSLRPALGRSQPVNDFAKEA